ncbi:MAG: hypothetical protein KC766_01970 [Myxococcales bacterium]|nr:hypothetical protein [Myxococcales bacterium]
MRRLTPLLLLPLALAFAACGGNTSNSDPGSGGSGGNGGTGAASGNGGSGGGEACGNAICGAGTYCCNASCSQCVAEGEGCSTIACGTGGGGGGQAGGGGAGGATFQCGVETCQAGQQCCGTECGAGFCADGELPCPPVDCQPQLCGQVYCDEGTFCCNSSCGTCVRPDEDCTDELCEPDCDPQRARGEGDCDGFFGWTWTGTSCSMIGGCSCAGPDCGSLYLSQEDCWKAHEMCPIPL